ncbi:MAG: serine/threonine-protein phosphatase [Clostridiales bacterium]|nr:serine/threonine-protein phosphatase [Clostridiales bacterium]
MKYWGGAVTDVGIKKTVNQDSLCLKIVDTEQYGQIAMAVICDGMGGLARGELASAEVIRVFDNWFRNVLPKKIGTVPLRQLAMEINHIVKEQNHRITNYGKRIGEKLGTTLSMFLAIQGEYLIVHVGDCRIYEITEEIRQLTEDQTFIAREMKYGRMTPKEALTDRRRNVLLQCVGASGDVVPDILFGTVKPDAVYLLCSDGFRHEISEHEICESLSPLSIRSEDDIRARCGELVEVVKDRKERDNISVMLLRTVG